MGFWSENDNRGTYVLCTWIDSYSRLDAAWHSLDDLDPKEKLIITTAGMLVEEDDDYVTLAIGICSHVDDTRAMNIARIPKCSIQKIKRLKFFL